MPQKWTDAFIPMTITPTPTELVRVMVGRLEVLTADREKLAENSIQNLKSPSEQVRRDAFQYLRDQGRYVEPIVRRVLASTKDESVRTMCQRLLLTDLVTDLRSSLNSATNGSRLSENPDYVRARLASLLRDVGQIDEAKEEAKRVIAALDSEKAPNLSDPEARHHLRARVRALDGLGDDAAAMDWYGKFIRYASQVGTNKKCLGCHLGQDAPRDMAWYQDWWAGKNFARAASRAGKLDEQIGAQEAAVQANRNDVSALMMLAYLYEASGRTANAKSTWAKLGAATEPVLAAKSAN
jgi:tetratricopeptide (TPR) repeat protein